MQKHYIFRNEKTDEMVGFNANSLQQARTKMRRVAQKYFKNPREDWKLISK